MKNFKVLLVGVLLVNLLGCDVNFNYGDEVRDEERKEQVEKVEAVKCEEEIVCDAGNEFVGKIFVPEDIDEYERLMTSSVQEGEASPAEYMEFVENEVDLDKFRATASAAAQVLKPSGGPQEVRLVYFKINDGVAYVLLNADVNSWAGSSVFQAKIRPIIEKSLLDFDEIDEVRFEAMEGDVV